jgi:ABC-2 type transport system permease protein
MYSLLKKEISAFLSSAIGYIVLAVFLTAMGLLMWILPVDSNIIDSGYSGIDPLFVLAPWVFLFLIPAITMRSFAEEKKTGTIELLLSHPISDLQIILAKYMAGLFLVILSLVPTLVYYFSVYQLGNPAGNIDNGRTWGSYLGLLFLASGFCAVGIYSSIVSNSQVTSFIIAVILSYLCYAGLGYLGGLVSSGSQGNFLQLLGISAHYSSMSRGVIDTRDVLYFISITLVFILLSKAALERRKW